MPRMNASSRCNRFLFRLAVRVMAVVAALMLAGCAVDRIPFTYKIEVEQGNVLDQEDVDALEEGMTRTRVRQLLGQPALEHPFHPDRWDYIYSIQGGTQTATERRLTLRFDEDDRIAAIEGDRDWAGARPDTEDDQPILPEPADEPAPPPGGGGQQPPPQPQPQPGGM